MAYTKILVIHNRLDKCVGYTQDQMCIRDSHHPAVQDFE